MNVKYLEADTIKIVKKKKEIINNNMWCTMARVTCWSHDIYCDHVVVWRHNQQVHVQPIRSNNRHGTQRWSVLPADAYTVPTSNLKLPKSLLERINVRDCRTWRKFKHQANNWELFENATLQGCELQSSAAVVLGHQSAQYAQRSITLTQSSHWRSGVSKGNHTLTSISHYFSQNCFSKTCQNKIPRF